MSNNSATSDQIISLPKAGGALHGIGEKFSPDLHTGTGNFTVPIALPSGRNGFQPQLNLLYSTGNGNGAYGEGWTCGVPGVARRVSKGVPRYNLDDVFILSGAEDLVSTEDTSTRTRYRPRTEGLFARIDYHHDTQNKHDYWEVQSKDGLVSFYGTPGTAGSDPAIVSGPTERTKVFAWKLTQTLDPFGNRIEYEYEHDSGEDGPDHWDQLYLKRIRYVDYTENGEKKFLASVAFEYEDRPDPFSEYRAGFEIRTRKRCTRVEIRTHADQDRLLRVYHLIYLDQRPELEHLRPINGVSLLSQIKVVGHDGVRTEALPPLEFGYTTFEPKQRHFFPLQGAELPARSLADPDTELVGLFGNGLPDVLETNGTVRYWRNLGDGTFDLPRVMNDAPAALRLSDSGVQLIDANGDGRTDLLVTTETLSGYFRLRFEGAWDRQSFQRYRLVPTFNLEDPEVRLLDLDGDGVTDAIRSGTRLECFFNDPREGWNGTRRVERKSVEDFPNVNFSDLRVRFADMSGDGLQDIVLVSDGKIQYWPALGYGDWGKPVSMRKCPRFPYGHDPKRILIGDVDGDGSADLVYIDDSRVLLWINQSGNRWSDPIEIEGTPPVSDMDSVRLVDLLGAGISGILWTKDSGGLMHQNMFFLDFTGGIKPYLVNEMDNHMGAITKVEYRSSTYFYSKDQRHPEMRWKATLPFPVQVVARIEVIDHFSGRKQTKELRYRNGLWDGAEREFCGFGMVEELDSETPAEYNSAGLHGDGTSFAKVEDPNHFSPPLVRRTWFFQGPIGDEFGEWKEMDSSEEFWPSDPQMLARPQSVTDLLNSLPRRARRDALRTLRGNAIRTELYARDGTDREFFPYTVAEHVYGLREVDPPPADEEDRLRIFFPHILGLRTTQWERGDDPKTQFSFTEDYDQFGQPQKETQIACPRGWKDLQDTPGQAYLVTRSRTGYATPVTSQAYIVDRVAKTTSYEIVNDGTQRVFELRDTPENNPSLKLVGQTLNFYDGPRFTGSPFGLVGEHGALMRSEKLILTEDLLHEAYKSGPTVQTSPETPPYFSSDVAPLWTPEYPNEFRTMLPITDPHDPSRPGLTITPIGYGFADGAPGWPYVRGYFAAIERLTYDFHDDPQGLGRGLVKVKRDSLGRDTSIAYDQFGLLPVEVTDPAGLTRSADYDYRVLQPREGKDPNGNRIVFTFTPLALPETIAVIGKNADEGDTAAQPSTTFQYGFLAFDNSPPEDRQPVFVQTIKREQHRWNLINEENARRVLNGQAALTVAEIQGMFPPDEVEKFPERFVQSREYSDGFGRLLQTRTQAEDVLFGETVFGGGVVPPLQGDPHTGNSVVGQRVQDPASPNVVVSGWQVYDNKGQVVEKYERFFSAGWDYFAPINGQFGQKVTIYYDPRGRAVSTVNPDGSEQRVIYGAPVDLINPEEFTPTFWEVYTYDANDNAGRTNAAESSDYQHSRNTPTSVVIDALGRTVETVVRNRDRGDPSPPIQEYRTRSTYDIRGNLLAVQDALGRITFRHFYDLTGNPLRVENIDFGVRCVVVDAVGNLVEHRDSKGALKLFACDELNRPRRIWARDAANQRLTLRECLIYGDSPDSGFAKQNAAAANLLSRPYRHYDEAGLLVNSAYDFKGNILEEKRQVISDAAILSVFDPAPANWLVQAFRANWQPPNEVSLEDFATEVLDPIEYRTSLTYDALNRVKTMRYPNDKDDARKELRTHYNRAGALEAIDIDGTTFVERIAYNAQKQRVLLAYGNGVITRHAYDPRTFRVVRMLTERYSKPDSLTYHPTGMLLQDFAYDYDLTGNIVRIQDRTSGCGVLDNPDSAQVSDAKLAQLLASGDALIRRFEYDSLYRLTSATGRECKSIPQPRPWEDDPRCGYNSRNHGTPTQDNAPHLTTIYREQYAYDPVGNMVVFKHSRDGDSKTRNFGVDGMTPQQWSEAWPNHLGAAGEWLIPPGDRLTHVGDDSISFPQTHFYDPCGNMIQETTSRHLEWDHSDRMRVYRTQLDGSEPSVHAQYLYDAAGQRVKKLIRKQAGQLEVTVYIGDIFEHQRIVRAGATQENYTLHVMCNRTRIAVFRVGTPFPGDASPGIKFYLADQLGSTNIVIDDHGSWINREEYFPYGETSFGSFARKRFRFAGKERDDESGFCYHGARYFAPWIARWASCDPAGAADGLNLYCYVGCNPISRVDPSGMQDQPAQTDTAGTENLACSAESAQETCVYNPNDPNAVDPDYWDAQTPSTITPPGQPIVDGPSLVLGDFQEPAASGQGDTGTGPAKQITEPDSSSNKGAPGAPSQGLSDPFATWMRNHPLVERMFAEYRPVAGDAIPRGAAVSGVYVLGGVAGEQELKENVHTGYTAEELILAGVNKDIGGYVAVLGGVGAKLGPAAVTSAQEKILYSTSGQTPTEHLLMGEVERKPFGGGFWIEDTHFRSAGVFGFFTFKDVGVVGIGLEFAPVSTQFSESGLYRQR